MVEAKLQRLDQIKAEFLKQQQEYMNVKVGFDSMAFHMSELHKQGLIKTNPDNELVHVESFEEAEALRKYYAEDAKATAQLQNQILYGPYQVR